MENNIIPEFAIVGHPNEGKSSVVSTLVEDDSVRISPIPGETKECRVFPVLIDGLEIIRFVDTPGFQTPKKTLSWLIDYNGPDDLLIKTFCETNKDDKDFENDSKLLAPIARGAAIIYVADGSRPIRKVDLAEWEILRLTGHPRMAILNCKEGEEEYLPEWKKEFLKYFNSVRVFNAQNATYNERIALIENLRLMVQEWEISLGKVITAFKQDWEIRNERTAWMIYELLDNCLTHYTTENFRDESKTENIRKKLEEKYKQEIKKVEKKTHVKIKGLFRHNIFNLDLPDQSIVNEDLFSDKTWQVLGLRPMQLAAATSTAGGIAGIIVDIVAAKLTFGVFTIIGAAVGAGSAVFGGEKIAKAKLVGQPLGGRQVRVGPNKNLQFLYVLLDRALIHYSYIINWAHCRRDFPKPVSQILYNESVKKGFTSNWDNDRKKVCNLFFKAVQGSDGRKKERSRKKMISLLKTVLSEISNKDLSTFQNG